MADVIQAARAIDAEGQRAITHQTVYVYEAPVRLWHWINALAIVVLVVTGYLIGSPPPTVSGEASQNFLFGYIRFAHFAAGQILLVGLLFRIYWAFVGNKYSKQIFHLPLRDRVWRTGVLTELKWYFFMVRRPMKYVGHNPLAHIMMFFFMFLLIFMIVTGMALYAEGKGIGSWQYALFGWVFWIWPNSQDVHTFHHLGMWAVVIFVIVHIYAAVREDILSRQSMISSMVSGERVFRDELPN